VHGTFGKRASFRAKAERHVAGKTAPIESERPQKKTPERWQGRPGFREKWFSGAENNPTGGEISLRVFRGGESRFVNFANGN